MKSIPEHTTRVSYDLKTATKMANHWSKGEYYDGSDAPWEPGYSTTIPDPYKPGYWRVTNIFDPRVQQWIKENRV